MTWQPIETAPTDGEFLAYIPKLDRERVMQVRRFDKFKDNPARVVEPWKGWSYTATHWMPLPAPPEASS